MKKISGYWVMIHHYDSTKDLPAVVFTDSEGSAIDQVSKMFTTCKEIVPMGHVITWSMFKECFNTSDWPDFLREEEEGYFEEEVFEQVCDFCMGGFSAIMKEKNWTAIKVEHNLN